MSPRRSAHRAEGGAPLASSRNQTPLLRAVLLAAGLAAALPSAGAQKLQFRALTPDDGLSSSHVQAILQDSRGFMWLGTSKGLNRYDGYGFTIYRHRIADSTSLGGDDAVTMYEDSAKTLWVGTPAGLSRYVRERDSFDNFAIIPGQSVQVSAILEARGTLWLGTARGLYRFDRATGKATPYAQSLTGVDIQSVFEDSGKHLWLGTKGSGARELDPLTGQVKTWKIDPESSDSPTLYQGKDVRQFVEDAEGAIYVAFA